MTSTSPTFGVLMVNLGTPDSPDSPAVRRYLREFLSDPRVVDLSPWIWKPILNLVILSIRPPKVARLYQKVWMEEGSPLLVLGERLRSRLEQKLNGGTYADNGHIPVVQAMTYGNPSIRTGLDALLNTGVERVVVVPMYPQFSGTTTAAVYDGLFKALSDNSNWPELHLVRDYVDQPLYVDALAKRVEEQWHKQGEKRHLVLSYHGIPKRYESKGDPYAQRCLKTSQLLAQRLGLDDTEWTHVYQSRFGREEWLRPYADETLKQLAQKGRTKINIVSPAFSIDCLETLEEVSEELKELFIEAGGEAYDYVPALNDSDEQVALYEKIVVDAIGLGVSGESCR